VQTAQQVFHEDTGTFKNCNSWAEYEWPMSGSTTEKLCNGGMYRPRNREPEWYDTCPSRSLCREATRRKEEPERYSSNRSLPQYNAPNENKVRVDAERGPVHVQSQQMPNKLVGNVISPQDVLGMVSVSPAPAVAPAPPAQAAAPAAQPAPQPPQPAQTSTVVARTPYESDWMTKFAAKTFEEKMAEARTSIAMSRPQPAAQQPRAVTPPAPTAPASPYRYSGVAPDPRTHATPVVPPTTHPAGMQTPFAHDPMFQHQIPVFIPTHTDDIGIRMVLNMFQSMLAAAGYSIFSYARVVDLFAGFFR
jgi:hypothetical protein